MKLMKYQQLEPERLNLAVSRPDVFIQQKIDGIRAMLRIRSIDNKLNIAMLGGAGTPLKSTTAKPTADLITNWANTVFKPNGNYDIAIDGELIGDTYWAFDLVRSPKSNEHTPALRRYELLQAVTERLPNHPNFRVLPAYTDAKQKLDIVDAIRSNGGEGILIKSNHSPYQWGERVRHSLKVKFTHTVDCIILNRNTGGPDKQNATLGITNTNGNIDILGNCSMIGKPDAQPGQVVEVKYLYVGAGGKLVQPTLLRIREDKTPNECTIDQLSFVNKTVLELETA